MFTYKLDFKGKEVTVKCCIRGVSVCEAGIVMTRKFVPPRSIMFYFYVVIILMGL